MAYGLTTQQTNEIVESLASGNKIKAIKLYRQYTGKSLQEAHDVMAIIIPELIQKDPNKFAKLAKQGKGCASVIVAGLSLLAGGVILFLKYG